MGLRDDPAAMREYKRKWVANRRAEFFKGKCCVECGSTEKLELDHIDPTKKTHHAIWSWAEPRRLAEIAKCQVLCKVCHLAKSIAQMPITHGWTPYQHGTVTMYERHGCKCDLCRDAKRRKNAATRKRRAERELVAC